MPFDAAVEAGTFDAGATEASFWHDEKVVAVSNAREHITLAKVVDFFISITAFFRIFSTLVQASKFHKS